MLKSIRTWPTYFPQLVEQMTKIGTNSIPIVMITSTFSGMVTAVQSAYQFSSWIPDYYVGSAVGESVILELGPMITGLVLTGRVGATIAAELGTMRVTEQIDALVSLSFDPITYLVFPRIIAGLVMFPVLVIIADLFGVGGGIVTANIIMDVSYFNFIKGFRLWFHSFDAWFGLIKGATFGFAITSIAAYYGLNTRGGAAGVGKSTTQTVVFSCIAILILDYVLAGLFL